MNRYCISESCIVVRDYMVDANSEEEAREKFRQEGGEYCPNDNNEEISGSHQIEEIELYEEDLQDSEDSQS